MESKSTVADTVRAEMARHRVTQSVLAERLETSQAAVSRRLNGEVSFSVDELVAAADLFGIAPASLLPAATPALADSHTSSDRSPKGSDETAGDVPAGPTSEGAASPAASSEVIASSAGAES